MKIPPLMPSLGKVSDMPARFYRGERGTMTITRCITLLERHYREHFGYPPQRIVIPAWRTYELVHQIKKDNGGSLMCPSHIHIVGCCPSIVFRNQDHITAE